MEAGELYLNLIKCLVCDCNSFYVLCLLLSRCHCHNLLETLKDSVLAWSPVWIETNIRLVSVYNGDLNDYIENSIKYIMNYNNGS